MKFFDFEYEKYVEYLNKLVESQKDSKKPFDCEQLIVLPEDLSYGDFSELKKGTLVCKFGASKGIGQARCCVDSTHLNVNEEGDLEFECGQTGSGFVVKLKSFEYREPFDES